MHLCTMATCHSVCSNINYGAVWQVLVAQGQTLVSPGDRQGLHPLLIPLAVQPSLQQNGAASQNGNGAPSGEQLTCILRWPDPTSSRVVVALLWACLAPACVG